MMSLADPFKSLYLNYHVIFNLYVSAQYENQSISFSSTRNANPLLRSIISIKAYTHYPAEKRNSQYLKLCNNKIGNYKKSARGQSKLEVRSSE